MATIDPFHPFNDLTDEQLTNITLFIKVTCGRSKLARKGRGHVAMCGVGNRLDLLRQSRGLPALVPPFHAPPKNGAI